VLALGDKLGPVLWQLPPNLGFDPGRLAAFFDLVPRTTGAAAALAARHEPRMEAVGRVSTVHGLGSAEVTCDGATHKWSAEIVPDNGKFAGGRAAEVTFAVACGVFDCGFDFEQRTIRLRG
jgi:hypothetical protein